MPMTTEQCLAEVRRIQEKYAVGGAHPVWRGLAEGTHTLPQIREFARQFGIIPLHNHNYHGRLYVSCPNARWRARLAEVVYEEGTGRLFADGVSHNELYYRFGEGLGLSRADLDDVDYCAEALVYKGWLQNACGQGTLVGVSAHMLADEGQVAGGHFTRLARTLEQKYDLPPSATAFFSVHDVADADHSSIGEELLADFAPTDADKRLVIETVEQTLGLLRTMYDGIYKRMQAAG
ncbi:MAG: TenA family transcriptional regulator [Vicinamibacterales bacterium]